MSTATRTSAASKKTLTLVLNDAEMDVLESLSSARSLSKVAVLRQALRLYQTVDLRQQRGEKLFFENESSKEKAELMLL
ncbi:MULTISPECIES: transcriptional regulator [Burkholderiaceae]|uniref:Transcriptional regulator n=2 Tax=Burkholderia multivorans TaxID=87883 RepID=A0AB37APD3_9BURK|nr:MULTISPECIES: transcriptional regulator [Burkholderiaceae]PRE45184.1 transcriptional regulator [Burkholderia multivorans]PRE47231.1 transcriptional regulator [Burkholderia multivorans]